MAAVILPRAHSSASAKEAKAPTKPRPRATKEPTTAIKPDQVDRTTEAKSPESDHFTSDLNDEVSDQLLGNVEENDITQSFDIEALTTQRDESPEKADAPVMQIQTRASKKGS
ncbi:hypothetical protein NM208_g5350 [Fusarium decemcellulare]|uniref:Uncharacterized protein n=2 Tax=Fusarium decemcellulare TaxID=57161 RepID=A0ACC1S4N3_9HYPO|nr:hypothetical protein NM208_g8674 [Fusarium decemcellulare]KAJ3539792.1 hypothetical protein NM208_g5350 [Fusarium decemcellulare]